MVLSGCNNRTGKVEYGNKKIHGIIERTGSGLPDSIYGSQCPRKRTVGIKSCILPPSAEGPATSLPHAVNYLFKTDFNSERPRAPNPAAPRNGHYETPVNQFLPRFLRHNFPPDAPGGRGSAGRGCRNFGSCE